MRVNEAVVDRLAANSVEVVFGIPGTQTLPLNEAIESRSEMRFVMARHETAVSHQAWGYAETTGEMAATLVVPGPGDMNAMNGLKNALNDTTPLLHIAVETDPDLRGGDAIHETPPDTYDNVVKANFLIHTLQSATAVIDRAIRIAKTPPRGPVRVGLPKNFLKRDIKSTAVTASEAVSPGSVPDDALKSAAGLLADSMKPLIIAGGGVRAAAASNELKDLATELDAPVVTTYKGKGTIPEDDDYSAGVISVGASQALIDCIEESDVVIGVGTDFDAVTTSAWSVELSSNLIHITIDPDDIGIGYDPTISLVADAKMVLTELNQRVNKLNMEGENGRERAEWVRAADREQLTDLRDQTVPPLPSVAVLNLIRESIPRDTIVSVDAGGFRLWTLSTFPAYGPRTYVNPGSWATMGTGLPAAIGAAVAHPDKPVITIVGDGGLLMTLHELHTVATEDLAVITIVLNNDDYAIISDEAERSYRLSGYGWPDTAVSFSTVAEGLGVRSCRAMEPEEISGALQDAVQSSEPWLIEIPTNPDEPQITEWFDA